MSAHGDTHLRADIRKYLVDVGDEFPDIQLRGAPDSRRRRAAVGEEHCPERLVQIVRGIPGLIGDLVQDRPVEPVLFGRPRLADLLHGDPVIAAALEIEFPDQRRRDLMQIVDVPESFPRRNFHCHPCC